MTEQEKMIIEKLAQSEETINVPPSLSPENIEKMLKRRKKMPWWKQKKTYGLLAASIALVIGIGLFGRMNSVETMNGEAIGNLETNTGLTVAKSYDDVYECLENYQIAVQKETSSDGLGGLLKDVGELMEEIAVTKDAATNEMASMTETGASYSDTNVRTEGVGEADIIKTDGKYLYVMKESCMDIVIVDINSDRMTEISSIRTEDGAQISEFYVDGTQLFLFTTVSKMSYDQEGYEVYDGSVTVLETHDISNIEKPELVAKTEQSGNFQTSRIVGDYIYTFSRYGVYDFEKGDSVKEYVPLVDGTALEADEIYLPAVPAACQYVVVTSVNMGNPREIVDQKAVLTEYGECYVSTENIYIYETSSRVSLLREDQQMEEGQTVIRKLSYKDGKISGEAQGNIIGWINDSFSIDEYEGNLRVVTTVDGIHDRTNSVYVLDKGLNIIGEINGIAKEERVYSARLYGDTGYFVTYKEVDPLFTVDFSDPTNPQIIGQLKIPGFSEYLHFYGDGKLLGIGLDTEEKTGVTNGLKLSMFDISDPADVKDADVYVIEDMYSSDVFWDYKAVMVDHEKNLIGFSGYNHQEEYFIFEYSEKCGGFQLLMQEEVNGTSYMSTRGLYVGERYYIIKGNAIESYDMRTFEKLDDILL